MNAVEIEGAVSTLAEQPFDPENFPFAFLEAFGNKETTIKRLRAGTSNQSDLPGGVLQRNNIHIQVCSEGQVPLTLNALRESPATSKQKVKFILATDGKSFEAENIIDGETVACEYANFADHFGFFLALAGITTVKQIRENAFDIKATGRLNRLYIELLKENPDWGTAARREDLNHFMARLIFCFFAEDTGIFNGQGLFTATIEQMSARDSSNTHEVISEVFRAMNTRIANREAESIRSWANTFPYVNGGLFSGSVDVPQFSRIARSYLLHVGNLDWTKINPDIFGSMIQAVADDEERGALGMHYTSVPNILKVLNPLFLDDLQAQLEDARDNARKLLNLRQRIARIRVFDPACGSGNFLVIAYKQMREIEAEINKRRGEAERRTEIPLTNFRGIELRHFATEIARLALIIAEYQSDVLYRGQKLALAEFLPLEADNWITCGNALRLDWLSICPPAGTAVKLCSDDLFSTPLDQTEIDFENTGGETYICGNPPFAGQTKKTNDQRSDMDFCLSGEVASYKNLDYVSCWYFKAAKYQSSTQADYAFVSTNSVCQGRQVELMWPKLLEGGAGITFCHRAFKWQNNAQYNAGVTCIIVGVSQTHRGQRIIYEDDRAYSVDTISPYLTSHRVEPVRPAPHPLNSLPEMTFGSMANDGGALLLSRREYETLRTAEPRAAAFGRRFVGADELINGSERYCIWLTSGDWQDYSQIQARVDHVREVRELSTREATRRLATVPHLFGEIRHIGGVSQIAVPRVSSEGRGYLPVALLSDGAIVGDRNFVLYGAQLWNLSLIASRLHWIWIDAVCGKLESRFNYSNTLGWNTFPVPLLTEQNTADLTRCAEQILLAREAHFPATIADLYDPETMPSNLRDAHEHNDETLERIYIGRRFKNDTERLERLFELYAQMTSKQSGTKKTIPRKKKTRET